MRPGSSTCRRRRSGPRCSTPARCPRVRSARCTACWRRTQRCASAATSSGTRRTASPSCSRRAPTRSGAGTSPSSWARSSGRTTTSTSCSTSSAATWSAGCWPVRRAAALAKVLIAESCERQHIVPDQLTIHADRGPSMTSQPVALLLATLGVVPSHSPAAGLRRQPVLRSAVQDAQVPARLPGPVRRLRGRRDLLPAVLPLVQPRASPWRPRPDDTPRHPPRSGRGQVAAARRDSACRLPGAPRALPARGASPPAAADGGLDQQAPGGAGARRARGILCAQAQRDGLAGPRSGHGLTQVSLSGGRVGGQGLAAVTGLRRSAYPGAEL